MTTAIKKQKLYIKAPTNKKPKEVSVLSTAAQGSEAQARFNPTLKLLDAKELGVPAPQTTVPLQSAAAQNIVSFGAMLPIKKLDCPWVLL